MPAIHIRDVPPDVVLAIRERAAAEGRSMQAELRDILGRAAREPRPVRELEPLDLIIVEGNGGPPLRREDMYGDDGR